jgi:hypothetical protein
MKFLPIPRAAIAVLLLFAAGEVYLIASLAEQSFGTPAENVVMAPQSMGILKTEGNNDITVNDVNSMSGATILSGDRIETPARISANIRLGSRGSLAIEPNTKLIVEFDQSGIKAVLAEGCANLRTQKGTTGEIITPEASSEKTDPAQDGKLETCPRRSNGSNLAGGVRADGLFHLGTAAAAAIIVDGATTVVVPVAPRGVLY